MQVKFHCEHCNNEFSVPLPIQLLDEIANQFINELSAKCPQCGRTVKPENNEK